LIHDHFNLDFFYGKSASFTSLSTCDTASCTVRRCIAQDAADAADAVARPVAPVARAGDVGPQTGSTGVKPEVPGIGKNLGNMLEKELRTPEIHVSFRSLRTKALC
jgi:hypothetical protein